MLQTVANAWPKMLMCLDLPVAIDWLLQIIHEQQLRHCFGRHSRNFSINWLGWVVLVIYVESLWCSHKLHEYHNLLDSEWIFHARTALWVLWCLYPSQKHGINLLPKVRVFQSKSMEKFDHIINLNKKMVFLMLIWIWYEPRSHNGRWAEEPMGCQLEHSHWCNLVCHF